MEIKVGLCYNLVKDFPFQIGQPEDIGIEWSDEAYINLVKEGLQKAGFEVKDIGNPLLLMNDAVRKDIDIVFSLAEMMGYRYREILVPTLCEMYQIPYLFAKPDAMLITADKHLSNLVVEREGIAVPCWFLAKAGDIALYQDCKFPLIVKPNAEGSSMGIQAESIVWNVEDLEKQVNRIFYGYNQPAIVQKFIQGSEITIGVIQQNGHTLPMKPLQTFTTEEGKTMIFDQATKKDYKQNKRFQALESPELVEKVQQEAKHIFEVIGCRDAARIDFRWQDNTLYFIEINGLTDFHPQGAFCKSAEYAGITYTKLLKTIVLNAFQKKYQYA